MLDIFFKLFDSAIELVSPTTPEPRKVSPVVTSYMDDAIVYPGKDLNISGHFSKMGEFSDLEKLLEKVLADAKKIKPSE